MAVKGTGLTLPGLKAEFFQRFNEVSGTTYWGDLCTRIPSTRAKETYAFLGSVPPVREWGTGRLARGLFSESYDIENLKYELTMEVDRDEIDDDQTGQIRIRTRELADRVATHKDTEVARLLTNGHSAGYHSYDGVPFFGSTHESGKSGTQDNTLKVSATDANNPTTAEFRTALKNAIATILTFKDDQGEVMSLSTTGLVCVVPPSMLITALEQNSDEGFLREKFLYGVRARYRVTYGYWQYALKITFA